MINRQRD